MSDMWGVFNLMAFLGLPILFYLVVAYYYPLWKEAIYGKQPEPEDSPVAPEDKNINDK